jgi:thioredoxin-like negative regulator of GroEL
MIDLYNADTNVLLGEITEHDLQVLIDALEEESSDDQDYYITADTLDVIGENGRATDHLLNLLRTALGTSEGVEIRWQRR